MAEVGEEVADVVRPWTKMKQRGAVGSGEEEAGSGRGTAGSGAEEAGSGSGGTGEGRGKLEAAAPSVGEPGSGAVETSGGESRL